MTATIERPTLSEDVTVTATDQPTARPTDQISPAPVAVAAPVAAPEATPEAPETSPEAAPAAAPEPEVSLLLPPEGAGVARERRPDEVRLLGFEVSWRVTGALVSRADLAARLAAAELSAFYPKEPPALDTALRRAIAEWASSRTGIDFAAGDEDDADVIRRKKLIREVPRAAGTGRDKAGIVLALVQEDGLEEALSLRYAVSYRFALTPPATGGGEWQLTVSNMGRGAIGPDERIEREVERQRVDAAVRVAWEKHRNYYTGAQVAALLKAIMLAWDAVSVESGSGIWYVPGEAQGAKVDRLEGLIRALPVRTGGTPAHLRVREQIDWPRTRRALAEAAQEALAQEIKVAERRLAGYEAAAEDKPGSVKTATIAGLLDELRAVRNKAELYADTVGMRQGRLQKQAADLGDRAVGFARKQRDARLGRSVAVIAAPVAEPVTVPAPEPVAAAAPVAVALVPVAAAVGVVPDTSPEAEPVAVAAPVARPERQQRATR